MVGSRCDKQGDMSFINISHLPEQDNRLVLPAIKVSVAVQITLCSTAQPLWVMVEGREKCRPVRDILTIKPQRFSI